jgi:3-oxoacyl-[acyl-carrier protein] reductase
VNNAGILRDRMIFNMSEEEWDAVIRVHLKGHFCTMRHAGEYWRDKSKAADGPVYGRIINTLEAGLGERASRTRNGQGRHHPADAEHRPDGATA